jgi:hypothetical protein
LDGYHGNGAVWTALADDGVTLADPRFVEPDGSIRMKFPWWRGVEGDLVIEGRRLDVPAPPLRVEIPEGYGGEGQGELGFYATALFFPTGGCWEVTGRVGEASLTFVTLVVVAEEGSPGTPAVASPVASGAAPDGTPGLPEGYPTVTLATPVPEGAQPPPARFRVADWGYPFPSGCRPEDVVATLEGFIDAFNRGDLAAAVGFFPAEAAGGDIESLKFQWYSVGGAPGTFNPGFIAPSRDELRPYLATRHAEHERMQLLRVEMAGSWRAGEAALNFDVLRQADDIPPHEAGGKGGVDCAGRKIILWNLGDRPVLPDAWFADCVLQLTCPTPTPGYG